MGTLGDLSAVIGLLLRWFDDLGVWRLLVHFDHIWGAGFGSRRESTERQQRRGSIGVQAFGLELSVLQEQLPLLHLVLEMLVVRLLSGVEPKGSDANLFDLIFCGSKQ